MFKHIPMFSACFRITFKAPPQKKRNYHYIFVGCYLFEHLWGVAVLIWGWVKTYKSYHMTAGINTHKSQLWLRLRVPQVLTHTHINNMGGVIKWGIPKSPWLSISFNNRMVYIILDDLGVPPFGISWRCSSHHPHVVWTVDLDRCLLAIFSCWRRSASTRKSSSPWCEGKASVGIDELRFHLIWIGFEEFWISVWIWILISIDK